MRPASAKAKGRRLQQQVASDLCDAFGLSADDVRSCPMGSHGEDVQLSEAARRVVPWSIECKNQEKLNFWAAFEQAEANAGPRHVPVVVAKRNRHDPLCTMRWRDAVALLTEAKRPCRAHDARYDVPEEACEAGPEEAPEAGPEAPPPPMPPPVLPLCAPRSDVKDPVSVTPTDGGDSGHPATPSAPNHVACLLRKLADHIEIHSVSIS